MFQNILEQIYWGNSVLDYLVAVVILLSSFIVIKIFQYYILRHLKKWVKKTDTTLDDFIIGLIHKIFLPLAYLGALYLSLNSLHLEPFLKKIITIIGMAVLTIFTVKFVIAVVDYGFTIYWKRRGKDIALEHSFKGILRVIKVIIWGLAIVFFLDNLGFKVSAVLAGIGIGGVAVALAAQAVLGDLFSYFAILFDRPFEVGDFIITGEYLGTVEHVGIKTTRIRSLSGEQLVFSNSDLTNSRVRNYKRMEKRRVVFKVGVVYQTPLDKLKKIPKAIENIIKGIEDTTFDRAHFFSFGDFSLVFEIVYYIMGADYNKYMDIQQKINFAIAEEFKKLDVEFAYPTQTLYVNKEGV